MVTKTEWDWRFAGRALLGIALGYVVFVLGAWVAQEAILGGVSFYDPPATLLLAGLLTPLSSLIGAVVTLAVAGRPNVALLLPMCSLIVVETAVLYTRGRVDGPLWFEAAAGGSLIAGALAGLLAWRKLLEIRADRHVQASNG